MAFCSNHLGFSLICSVLQKLTFPLSVYFKCLCKQQRIQLITEPSSHSAAQCPASSDCESDSTGALGDRKELAERENSSGGHAGTHGNKEKWNGAGHEQLLVLGAQEAVKGYVWLQSWIGCAEVAGTVLPTGLALQVLAELWVQVYVGAERAGWCAGDGPRAVLLPAALCAPELCRVKVNKKLWLRCPHTDCPLVKVCESCCSPALVADGCWFVIRSVTYMQRAGLGWRCPFWRDTVGLTAALQELVGVCISLAHDVKTGKEDEIQKIKMLSSSFPLYIYF